MHGKEFQNILYMPELAVYREMSCFPGCVDFFIFITLCFVSFSVKDMHVKVNVSLYITSKICIGCVDIFKCVCVNQIVLFMRSLDPTEMSSRTRCRNPPVIFKNTNTYGKPQTYIRENLITSKKKMK